MWHKVDEVDMPCCHGWALCSLVPLLDRWGAITVATRYLGYVIGHPMTTLDRRKHLALQPDRNMQVAEHTGTGCCSLNCWLTCPQGPNNSTAAMANFSLRPATGNPPFVDLGPLPVSSDHMEKGPAAVTSAMYGGRK